MILRYFPCCFLPEKINITISTSRTFLEKQLPRINCRVHLYSTHADALHRISWSINEVLDLKNTIGKETLLFATVFYLLN